MSEHQKEGMILTEAAGEESRRTKRRKMIKTGEIIFKHMGCLMTCRVMDLSDVGAKLQPDDPPACPDEFVLHIKSGPSHHCEVAWRHGDTVGVHFTGIAEFDPEYNGAQ